MRTVTVAAVAIVLSAVLPRLATAVDVVSCGQIVPAGEIGVLQSDLDCSSEAPGSDGVTLSRKSALDLQGHTLVGPTWTNEAQNGAVRCRFGQVLCRGEGAAEKCKYPKGTCRVFSSAGAGAITGDAVGAYSDYHLVLENLAIQVSNTAAFLNPKGKLTATNVTVTSSSAGLVGTDMILTDVSVTGSLDFGIYALLGGSIRGTNVTVNDNLRGGIAASKVKLVGLTATGNGATPLGGFGGGVYAGTIQLVNSTVTGNLFDGAPLDLESGRTPKLRNTICGTSRDNRTHAPWGVCAND